MKSLIKRPPGRFFFFSSQDDLHTILAAKYLRDRYSVEVIEFSSDCIASKEEHTFFDSSSRQATPLGTLTDNDVIWARRLRTPQSVASADTHTNMFVNAESQHALVGMIQALELPNTVNNPSKQHAAEYKIPQLRLARSLGFTIPPTLVTNSPSLVREFAGSNGDGTIVKNLYGTPNDTFVTLELTSDMLADEAAISATPSIYQSLVRARTHIRVNFFGDTPHAFSITSDVMDWRRKVSSNVFPVTLPQEVERRLLSFKSHLGLHLCVFDLIHSVSDEWVFLEANPQGQYLFLEGLTDVPLNSYMGDYLLSLSTLSR